MINTFKQYWANKFNQWLTVRVPVASEFELSNRNIFIFPTRFGLVYILVLLILFLLGTNYQNNVIILLSYLMGSFFITVKLTAFFNLKGLVIRAERYAQGFQGQDIPVKITLDANSAKHGLTLGFKDQSTTQVKYAGKTSNSNPKDRQTEVTIYFHANKRGIISPGRVKILSEHAFGLFRVWSWLDFGHELVVYPHPKAIASKHLLEMPSVAEDGELAVSHREGDEFKELASFKPGESMSRVAWKQLARGQGKLTKHYHQLTGQRRHLSLDMLPPVSIEQKLSYLCYLVLQYSQASYSFGLSLTQKHINADHGEQHKQQCLRALAEFNG
ncbi:hypothetical protein [Thalassotalea montiporae]